MLGGGAGDVELGHGLVDLDDWFWHYWLRVNLSLGLGLRLGYFDFAEGCVKNKLQTGKVLRFEKQKYACQLCVNFALTSRVREVLSYDRPSPTLTHSPRTGS